MQRNNKSFFKKIIEFTYKFLFVTIPILFFIVNEVCEPCKPYIGPAERIVCYFHDFPMCSKYAFLPKPTPGPKPEIHDTYNAILDIPSIQSIREGWNITLDNSKFSYQFIDNNTPYRRTLVALVGQYDKGKTFILNKLLKKNFISTYSNSTPAFAFAESVHQPNYVFMDTMGLGRLSSSSFKADQNSHSLRNIKAIDHFIESSYSIAKIVFYVTDAGKNTDICSTRHRLNQLKELNTTVVVIHNLKDYEKVEAVELHISSDILNPEIGGIEKVSKKGCRYWSVDNSYHLVMAKEGSQSGDIFNQCAIDFINSNILVDTIKDKEINILNEIMQITEKNLPNFLKDPNISPGSFVKTSKDDVKDGFLQNFANGLYKKFNFFISGEEKEEQKPMNIINEHIWSVFLQDNTIKLKNDTFPIEFAYDDCCGFTQTGYTPQIDIISKKDSFSIVIDAPNSNVNWYCRVDTYNSKAYVSIERILPSYSKYDVQPSIDSRTYSNIRKEFSIPSASWVDCGKLTQTHVYKNGVSYVYASNKVEVQSPFEK